MTQTQLVALPEPHEKKASFHVFTDCEKLRPKESMKVAVASLREVSMLCTENEAKIFGRARSAKPSRNGFFVSVRPCVCPSVASSFGPSQLCQSRADGVGSWKVGSKP